MGNVCRCAGGVKLQDSGVVAPRRSCSCKAVAPEYQDEVEKALAEARHELDAARQRVFEGAYQIGRIIGHGAFAKVQACTHLQSGQEFAVKTVQKIEDDLKQREGGSFRTAAILPQAVHSNSKLAWCG
jgi:serine/threonine protein kinase